MDSLRFDWSIKRNEFCGFINRNWISVKEKKKKKRTIRKEEGVKSDKEKNEKKNN